MGSRKLKRMNTLFIALLAFITSVSAQDWPQYLGPNRNSESPQKNVLRSWPASGPEVLEIVAVAEPGYGNQNRAPIASPAFRLLPLQWM